MAWATPENIKNLWTASKVLPTDTKLTAFINTVEGQVRNEYGPDIQGWIDRAEIDLDFVADTVAWIVVDYLQTEGKPFASESQSYAGAGARSQSLIDTARTSLRLSGTDLAMFRPKNRTVKGSLFVASMAPRARERGFPYVGDYYSEGWRNESAPGNADGGL
jgi:hypothetical protein